VPAEPRVRDARAEDVADLVALVTEHAAYERATPPAPGLEERLRHLLFEVDHPRLHCFVAEGTDDRINGYATCAPEMSTWTGTEYLHLDCLFLREGTRGLGLGRLLLDAVRKQAVSRGLAEVQWQTPAWNVDAIRFYDRTGARSADKRRYTWPFGEPAQ
jgi:ribosomal protein S18 acetylase RimI-like enzyme